MLPKTLPGVLESPKHDRLFLGIDGYAERAGIPKQAIWSALGPRVTPLEYKWVETFNSHSDTGLVGLLYTGEHEDVLLRMQAITGALIRNFIDAKMMTLSKVVDLENAGGVEATVLVIPNFCSSSKQTALTAWKAVMVSDLITARAAQGLPSIVYAPDLELVAQVYGPDVQALLNTKYELVTA